MEISQKLSKLLLTYRAKIRLSQEDMAELCGISTRHYSDLERGKSDPKLSTVVGIFLALGCSLDLLIDPEDE